LLAMGGKQSKEKRTGLFTQQKDFVHNNNKKICLRAENDPQGHPELGLQQDTPSTPTASQPAVPLPAPTTPLTPTDNCKKSRHSPPVSRPCSSEYNHPLEGLGSIEEVWQDRARWAEFRIYLANINENNDSDDRPILADRYAVFLELYADLDAAERRNAATPEKLVLFNKIHQHDEMFFGRERCLKCIDAGKRSQVLKDIKSVKNKEKEPGTIILANVYSRVIDKLGELLGNYQNSLIEKINMAENR